MLRHVSQLWMILLFGGGLPASRRPPKPTIYGAPAAPLSSDADLLRLVALAACFFCEAACNTLEIVTERLIAPLCRGAAWRRPASDSCRFGLIRSLRQWLCSPSHNEKNCRLSRFIQISHNPPPLAP